MNEREVVMYFHVAFETHKFTVSPEADISHVMSIESLLFSLDVELL